MEYLKQGLRTLLDRLDRASPWLAPLALRLLLAREFWDAGMAKLSGQNGFSDIRTAFPFPIDLLPMGFTWHLVTGLVLIAPFALALGLGTRLASFSLSILTLVAIASAQAGHGHTLAEGGGERPLMYLVMLLPLILSGPGKLSIDHWLRERHLSAERRLWS